jgi:hypothetical protein
MHDFSDSLQNTGDSCKRPSQPSARSPIGFKQGLAELHAVFAASDPTENPSIRQIVIVLPEGIPDFMREQTSGSTAVREFFLIAGSQLIADQSLQSDDNALIEIPKDDPLKRKTSLPNGGFIGLTIRKIKPPQGQERSIGGLVFENHGVAEYEQVTLIEFIEQ